jgi:glycerol-3-phosphate acyltransferase PlsY
VAGAGVINHVFGRSAEELTSTQMWLWMAVAAAAVLGHMYSIWLRFGGGKGVATGFGAIIAMFNVLTLPALAAVVVWYVTLRLSKYVSLASMLAVLTIPVSYLISVIPPHATNQPLATTFKEIWHASPPLFGTLAIALLVIWRHRGNIRRLRRGEEPKVGGKARRGSVTEMTSAE